MHWLLTLFLLVAPARVTAHVFSSTLMCRIPHNETNRYVDLGVQGYFDFGYQLNGLPSDPGEISKDLPAFNCEGVDVLTGYCELWYEDGKGPNHGYQRSIVNIPCR